MIKTNYHKTDVIDSILIGFIKKTFLSSNKKNKAHTLFDRKTPKKKNLHHFTLKIDTIKGSF